MEIYIVEKDIPCHCIKATSFPDGVMAAHQALHAQFAFDGKRRFYGTSRMEEKNSIAYWAAVEKLDNDDTQEERVNEFVIHHGRYAGTDIKNFRNNISAIGETFQRLLMHPQLDPQGFCLEWYYNMDDVKCMVPLIKNGEQ